MKNTTWLKHTFPIATLFVFRMLGLFMLIPVFTLYAPVLQGSSPFLIGLALGSYGFSQGLLQIPFGLLSDRYGRKPLITIGLLLLAIGSLLGATTDSIYGMIVARILQGAGAIGSVLLALLADLTPDQDRTKAMAVVGIMIAVSFGLALIISPLLTSYFGLPGIFYFAACSALLGLVMLHCMIPTPTQEPFPLDRVTYLLRFKKIFKNPHLQRLNLSIFFQHLIFTMTFFAIPTLLHQQQNQGHLGQQWHFYSLLMLGAFLIMMPLISQAEKKQQFKALLWGSVLSIFAAQLSLTFLYPTWSLFCGSMLIYFIGFNLLEASLPALVSKQATVDGKGAAVGVYSSYQFLGIFVGGVLSGLINQNFSYAGIFIVNSFLTLVWLGITLKIQPRHYQVTLKIPCDTSSMPITAIIQALQKLSGVCQVTVSHSAEQVIYLRVENDQYIPNSAEEIIQLAQKTR